MSSRSEEQERKKGLEREALSARSVHEALRSEGEAELKRSWRALGWSGLAAGISMGLSLIAEGVLLAYLPETPWRPLVSSAGYTVGFLAVTLGRQQLFTETTLTACLPMLDAPQSRMLGSVLRLWGVVLATNLLGAWLFAWTAANTNVFNLELQHAFSVLAHEAVNLDFRTAFLRGIAGGWIIALMVWLLPSAESARPWIIVLMTWLIASAGLTHIIAGSLEVFYGIAAGDLSWATYFGRYGVPVLLGNSLGGIVLVAVLNHAQVVAEGRR